MTLNSLRKYSHNRGPRSQRCCVGRPCPGDCALLLAWSERVHCFRSRQNSSQRLQRHDISDPSLHRESMDTILNKQCVWKGGLTATVRTALSRTRRSVCASRSCLFRGLRPHEGTRNLANPPGVQEQKSLVSLAWLPQFASLWQHRPAQSLANPSATETQALRLGNGASPAKRTSLPLGRRPRSPLDISGLLMEVAGTRGGRALAP